MFSAFLVNCANMKPSATIDKTTIAKSASCDMVKGFLVDDAPKINTF